MLDNYDGYLLWEQFQYRKRFEYLAYCKDCNWGFNSMAKPEICVNCDSKNIIILDSSFDDRKLKQNVYFTKCSNCGKLQTSFFRREKCQCGAQLNWIKWSNVKLPERVMHTLGIRNIDTKKIKADIEKAKNNILRTKNFTLPRFNKKFRIKNNDQYYRISYVETD